MMPGMGSSTMELDFPGTAWDDVDPKAAGFDPAALATFTDALRSLTTTSFMIVSRGRVAYRYGDVSEVSYLASTRKSILSLLYGPYVAAGRIDLSLTLEQLGIDDVKGLLPLERQATIRDILTSRSGVYYPAGSPGGDDAGTPQRGSHLPGTRFHYNNWDFNVAGAIFEQLTGIAVHDALRDQLAIPLGFEDFDRGRQRMLGYPDRSRFLAYHMFLSGRDMARVGLLGCAAGAGTGSRSCRNPGCGKASHRTSGRRTCKVASPIAGWATVTIGGSRCSPGRRNGRAPSSLPAIMASSSLACRGLTC